MVTQRGEGYLTGGQTKKDVDNSFFIRDGRYTTLRRPRLPALLHAADKGQGGSGKNIVMGPAYMVLAGLPLPLAVPFGYFPFTDSYASGIIVPSFGDDYNRGFYLSNGGYYFAINDNIDLALTGEIYAKVRGDCRRPRPVTSATNYSGNFNLSYLKTITGEKGSPDHSSQTNFSGALEPHPGFQGQPEHVVFVIGQFHDFRLLAQRP